MKTISTLVVVSALLVMVAGCGHQEEPTPLEELSVVAVRVTAVAAAEVPLLIRAVGSTEPYARTTLATRLMGRIASVSVNEGDLVRQDQVLVQIENADLMARGHQAEAGLLEARAVLANAEKNVERMRNLFRENAVPEQKLDEAETGYARAKAAVAAAEQGLRAVDVNLGYSSVKATLDGVVVQKFVQPGDMAAPGGPLLAVEQQDSIKVTVEINEGDRPYVVVGQSVDVEIEALRENRVRPGRVESLVPAADPGSRTFQVRVVVPNTDGLVGSGMFARVGFPKGMREALLVPSVAVVSEGQLRGVYVHSGGKARLRWVRLGRTWGERVEVLSGLDAGTPVIVSGLDQLRDGRPVEVKGNA
jgi:RND family efflux transporter MFP subunit